MKVNEIFLFQAEHFFLPVPTFFLLHFSVKSSFHNLYGKSIQKLRKQFDIKVTSLYLSTSYSVVVIKIYYKFKIEKIVSHKNLVIFSFL